MNHANRVHALQMKDEDLRQLIVTHGDNEWGRFARYVLAERRADLFEAKANRPEWKRLSFWMGLAGILIGLLGVVIGSLALARDYYGWSEAGHRVPESQSPTLAPEK